MRKVILRVFLVIAVVVFIFSGYQFFRIYQEYKKGTDEYQEVSEAVRLVQPVEESSPKVPEKEKKETFLSIDFGALKEKNPDLIAWIYMESCNISYPVVQGKDNETYLHRTFEGEYNGCGCIFSDYQSRGDFTDYNTFLYGHNMKNGAMFGGLKKLLREKDLYDEDPYFYVYTEDYIYKYIICSYYVTQPDSDSYRSITDEDDFDRYLKMVKARTVHNCSLDELETSRRMVTLSTCSGTGENKKRFLVHGLELERLPNIYHH